MAQIDTMREAIKLYTPHDTDAFREGVAVAYSGHPLTEWIEDIEQLHTSGTAPVDCIAEVVSAYLCLDASRPAAEDAVPLLNLSYRYQFPAVDWGNYGFEDFACQAFGKCDVAKQEHVVNMLLKDTRHRLEETAMLLMLGLVSHIRPGFDIHRAVAGVAYPAASHEQEIFELIQSELATLLAGR